MIFKWGGRLLWACTLCFNLCYRWFFNPQSQAFALHVLKYLFHLLNYYVSQKKVRSSNKLDGIQSLHGVSGVGLSKVAWDWWVFVAWFWGKLRDWWSFVLRGWWEFKSLSLVLGSSQRQGVFPWPFLPYNHHKSFHRTPEVWTKTIYLVVLNWTTFVTWLTMEVSETSPVKSQILDKWLRCLYDISKDLAARFF